MKPILYQENERTFDSNGIGALADAVSCKVIQVVNGQYELTLQYPVRGIHFLQIKQRRILLAKVDPVSELQPFRIYRITKPSAGIVTVYARHVAYDLAGVAVSPFESEEVGAALSGLSANAVNECLFTFSTDKTTAAPFAVAVPSVIWTVLGGSKGSILDVYGGEYEFDRWDVKLWNRRGADRGVTIRYGKNLTSLEQDENCANCYTGVMPYWVDSSSGTVTMLSGKIVEAEGNFSYTKILPLDLTGDFETAPTEEQLETAAREYISANKIGEPVVGWKVEFVQLEQTREYKGMALLERVLLGDTVTVIFEELDIDVAARAVEAQYDSLLERYDFVSLGSVRANITDTIVEQDKEIASKPGQTEMHTAIEALTKTILGATGGAVRFLDTDGDKVADTLYIADNPDPSQAVKVWRFNYEGWGASENGYSGPFTMGATLEDGLLAEFMRVGVLSSVDGTVSIDLSKNFVKLLGVDGNSMELSSGQLYAKDNDGTIRVRIGKIAGSAYLVALYSKDHKVSVRLNLFDDNITLAAPDLDKNDGSTVAHTIGWKSNGDGTSTLIGS